MDTYDRARANAARMLAPRSQGGKGLELVLVSKVAGEYDPVKGGTEEIITNFDGSGFRSNYDVRSIDGTYILQGDVKLLVSPSIEVEPKATDHIIFDGSDYTVVNVAPWNYAGVVCGYEVQCRG